MGTCLSKKITSNTVVGPSSVSSLHEETRLNPKISEKISAIKAEEAQSDSKLKKVKQKQDCRGEGHVKKEIFVIRHRKSYDEIERNPTYSSGNISLSNEASDLTNNGNKLRSVGAADSIRSTSDAAVGGVGVRTCSCKMEEVDAILIQCGRLSRSSSGKAIATPSRKYSGSKRSYDFEHCDYHDSVSVDDEQKRIVSTESNNDLCEDDDRGHRHRPSSSQSPRYSSQGRRRTPSREREQIHRSNSRERRVSRSPGRRSSETHANANVATGIANGNSHNHNSANMPGKMVSVPATVTSMVMGKINNGVVDVGVGMGVESAVNAGIKRISVKRNIGGEIGIMASRTAASPRSHSPARSKAKVLNDNQQQPSPRCSSSRKAEQSPRRRNTFGEIDNNPFAYPQETINGNKMESRNRIELEGETNLHRYKEINDNTRVSAEGTNNRSIMSNEQLVEEASFQSSVVDNIIVNTVVPYETDKPQILRTRSSRRSRDLDLNLEEIVNDGQSYTALLLRDIQNFHQKNTPSVQIPTCVTKACSIVEAVNDLTSTTSSNFSRAFSEDRSSPPGIQFCRNGYHDSSGVNRDRKKRTGTKDPFVESEAVIFNDVMEPSFHKYVTVNRGCALGGGDMEDQESSGSNSFVKSGQRLCEFPSSLEPNYADTTDCLPLSFKTKGDPINPMSLVIEEGRSRMNGKRECDHEHSSGIGRGRLGNSSKAVQAVSYVTSSSSSR